MMTEYEKYRKNPIPFRRVTTLTPEEFDLLLVDFAAVEVIHVEKNRRRPRKNKPGQGAKSTLEKPEDRLFFILLKLKTHPTDADLGGRYGMSECWANKWFHRLSPVLRDTLDDFAPARTSDELLEKLETLKMSGKLEGCDPLIDATERQIERPSDDEVQKKYYSGKKKAHTVKNILITMSGIVLFLGETVEGKKHDKKLAEECDLKLPDDTNLRGDLAFVGLLLTGGGMLVPIKKPKGKDLTEEQKSKNHNFSSIRAEIENIIGTVKYLRVVSERSRLKKEGAKDLIMDIASALSNYRKHSRG